MKIWDLVLVNYIVQLRDCRLSQSGLHRQSILWVLQAKLSSDLPDVLGLLTLLYLFLVIELFYQDSQTVGVCLVIIRLSLLHFWRHVAGCSTNLFQLLIRFQKMGDAEV